MVVAEKNWLREGMQRISCRDNKKVNCSNLRKQ